MSNDINAQIQKIESNIVETTQPWTKIMGIITNSMRNRIGQKEKNKKQILLTDEIFLLDEFRKHKKKTDSDIYKKTYKI